MSNKDNSMNRTHLLRYGLIVLMFLIFAFLTYQFNQTYREKRIEVNFQIREFNHQYNQNRSRAIEMFQRKKDNLRRRLDEELKQIYYDERDILEQMDHSFETGKNVMNSTLFILQQTFPDLFYRVFQSSENDGVLPSNETIIRDYPQLP